MCELLTETKKCIFLEQGIKIYEQEVGSFVKWYKENCAKINALNGVMDPYCLEIIKRKSKIDGMAQVMCLTKEKRKEIDLKLGFFGMFPE